MTDSDGAPIDDRHAEHVFVTEPQKKNTVDSPTTPLELLRRRRDMLGREGGPDSPPSASDILRNAPPRGRVDVFLDFPVTIDIHDASASTNNTLTTNGSMPSAVERNKSLCSAAGGSHWLTIEEEERISALLREEDGDTERYGFTHAEGEEREAELDGLLRGLGYNVDDANEDGIAAKTTSNGPSGEPGEPVLCALAKERALDEHERRVDRALFALLREPLPSVVHIPEDGTDAGKEGLSLALAGRSDDSCGGTTWSAALTAAEMQELIRQAKEALEEDELALADDGRVRKLARALLGRPRGTPSGALGGAASGGDGRSVMLLLEREIQG